MVEEDDVDVVHDLQRLPARPGYYGVGKSIGLQDSLDQTNHGGIVVHQQNAGSFCPITHVPG
jgi:hypothetical protein